MIEADEVYIGRDGSMKLKGPGPKFPVFSLVERQGYVRSFHVANVDNRNLHPIIARHADPKSRLMTDESPIYKGIGWNFEDHGRTNHRSGEYISKQDPTIHSNTVEGYFSILKRGIVGTFHHVSEAHLGRYLSEFDFRYNTRERLGVDDTKRAEIALKGVKGKRLTYETTGRRGQAQAGGATA